MKDFDCVEMKRESAARVKREIEGMTKAEVLACWQRGTEELLAEQADLREQAQTGRSRVNRGTTELNKWGKNGDDSHLLNIFAWSYH